MTAWYASANEMLYVTYKSKTSRRRRLPGRMIPERSISGSSVSRMLGFGTPSLQCEDGLEDYGICDTHFGPAGLDGGKVASGVGGLRGLILKKMAKENVGVEEAFGHQGAERSTTSSAMAFSAASRSSSAVRAGP